MPSEQLTIDDELARRQAEQDLRRLRKPAGKQEMEQAYNSETVTTGNTSEANDEL